MNPKTKKPRIEIYLFIFKIKILFGVNWSLYKIDEKDHSWTDRKTEQTIWERAKNIEKKTSKKEIWSVFTFSFSKMLLFKSSNKKYIENAKNWMWNIRLNIWNNKLGNMYAGILKGSLKRKMEIDSIDKYLCSKVLVSLLVLKKNRR